MKRLKLVQLQATTQKPINSVTNEIRSVVGQVCCGIDDMHMVGNKALVLRAEVEYPLSIQITSFSDDTDQKRYIPKVPG